MTTLHFAAPSGLRFAVSFEHTGTGKRVDWADGSLTDSPKLRGVPAIEDKAPDRGSYRFTFDESLIPHGLYLLRFHLGTTAIAAIPVGDDLIPHGVYALDYYRHPADDLARVVVTIPRR